MKNNPLWNVCVHMESSTAHCGSPWQLMWQKNHQRRLLLWFIAKRLVLPVPRLSDSSFELPSSLYQEKSDLKPCIPVKVEGIPKLEKYGSFVLFCFPPPFPQARRFIQYSKDWHFLSAPSLLIRVPQIYGGFQTLNLLNNLILKIKSVWVHSNWLQWNLSLNSSFGKSSVYYRRQFIIWAIFGNLSAIEMSSIWFALTL